MSKLHIRLYEKGGELFEELRGAEFEIEDFGGLIPSIGDTIVDPRKMEGREGSYPENRTVWTIVGRYFNPLEWAEGPVILRLIVESRAGEREECIALAG